MSEPMRLSKRLMQLVQCSRREAELYIAGGWVQVDGVVVEQPQVKVRDELVQLHPDADLTTAGPVTIVVHSCGTAQSVELSQRWAEDDTGVVPLACHLRGLQPCLPLHDDAEGMQVLSQDVGLVRFAAAALGRLEQEFVVQVQGELTPTQLEELNRGQHYQGRQLAPAKVSWQSEQRLRFALKQPQPGQLRFMCEQVGLQVQHVKRIRIGAIPLRKMPCHQWRYLAPGVRF